MSEVDLKIPVSASEFELPVRLFLLDGANETISARIRRVNQGFFQLRITSHIPVGKRLLLWYEGCPVELQVTYCQQPALGPYYLGAQVLSSDGSIRNKVLRLQLDIGVKVSVPGSLNGEDGRLIEASPFGLALILPRATDTGIVIAVDTGVGVAFGEVRTCEPYDASRFQVFMTFEEFISRPPSVKAAQDGRDLHSLSGLLRKLKNAAVS